MASSSPVGVEKRPESVSRNRPFRPKPRCPFPSRRRLPPECRHQQRLQHDRPAPARPHRHLTVSDRAASGGGRTRRPRRRGVTDTITSPIRHPPHRPRWPRHRRRRPARPLRPARCRPDSGDRAPAPPRDLTPGRWPTSPIANIPALAREMRRASLAEVPTAITFAGRRSAAARPLIITIPGKPSAIAACLGRSSPPSPIVLTCWAPRAFETDPSGSPPVASQGPIEPKFFHAQISRGRSAGRGQRPHPLTPKLPPPASSSTLPRRSWTPTASTSIIVGADRKTGCQGGGCGCGRPPRRHAACCG